MIVTINTDASFSNKFNIAAYAFWMISDHGVYKHGSKLRGFIERPDEAEVKTIINALTYLGLLIDRKLHPPVTRVIINTDCLNAIHLLREQKELINRYKIKGRCFKKALTKWYHIKINVFAGIIIDFRHVQSHTEQTSKKHYINDWCDKEAKSHLGILLIDKLKERKQQKQNVKNIHYRKHRQGRRG